MTDMYSKRATTRMLPRWPVSLADFLVQNWCRQAFLDLPVCGIK